MPKLNQDAQIKLSKKILTEILFQYDFKLQSYKLASNGIENTTALVETNKGKYALRIYRKNKKPLAHIKQELEFMDFLRKNKIKVPLVVPNTSNEMITKYRTQDSVWRCILMTKMTGSHPKQYSYSLLKDMAETQAKMHNLGEVFSKTQQTSNRLDILKEGEFIKNIPHKSIKNQKLLDFLKHAKRYTVTLDVKLPRGYNHLDFCYQNILSVNERLSAVLDFDDLVYSPVIVCLAYTLWDVYHTTKDIKKMYSYLKQYSKYRKLSKTELEYIPKVMTFRNYVIGAAETMFSGEKNKSLEKFISWEFTFNKIKF